MPDRSIGACWGRPPVRATLEKHSWIFGTERVGVEIELEGVQGTRNFRSEYWEVKADGSLRNGHEFVMRGPTGGIDLRNALVEIDAFLHGKNPDGNWRCSTHVHVDVRGLNCQQLKNFILIYAVLEKFLFKLSGIHRYKNNFCCALGFAQQQLKVLANSWNKTTTMDFTSAVVGGWDKYSALNLLPMTHFGSVEFRMSEAKWSKGKLGLLCNRFLAMRQLAVDWTGTEDELIEHILNADIREILPKGLGKVLPADYQEDLLVGYKLANDLLAFSRNVQKLAFGARNDEANAVGIWHRAIEALNPDQSTVPSQLYFGDTARLGGIGERVWEQIIDNFRHRHSIFLNVEMLNEMNIATYAWILRKGGWTPDVAINPRDFPDEIQAVRDWMEENPAEGQAPRPRPRPARAGARAQPVPAPDPRWFAEADGVDRVLEAEEPF